MAGVVGASRRWVVDGRCVRVDGAGRTVGAVVGGWGNARHSYRQTAFARIVELV